MSDILEELKAELQDGTDANEWAYYEPLKRAIAEIERLRADRDSVVDEAYWAALRWERWRALARKRREQVRRLEGGIDQLNAHAVGVEIERDSLRAELKREREATAILEREIGWLSLQLHHAQEHFKAIHDKLDEAERRRWRGDL